MALLTTLYANQKKNRFLIYLDLILFLLLPSKRPLKKSTLLILSQVSGRKCLKCGRVLFQVIKLIHL